MKAIETKTGSTLAPSELVLRPDGSIYHLGLRPDQIADTILIAGDPGRVEKIAGHFDAIEHRVMNREFVTITGRIGGRGITAMSTGIGVDNIDIVLNELDALRNIDLEQRTPFAERRPLRIIRIGTSGALNKDIETGSFVHSDYSVGLDGVMHFYDAAFEDDEQALAKAYIAHTGWSIEGLLPYAVRSDRDLGSLFGKGFHRGITATACGFYGPQGRVLRIPAAMPELNDRMSTFSFRGLPMANYEMESSALFALGSLLGHSCTTVCLIIANRLQNAFLADYKPRMAELIEAVIEKVVAED
ncbi:MAG: nucleoside phosphorylase [Cryomorphaceae bacterium]|nr:nucleoside phosphorylase [Flavobacteriales bacterium]